MPFPACCQIGPPKDFEIKFVLNNERNKFSCSCPCGLRYFSTLESYNSQGVKLPWKRLLYIPVYSTYASIYNTGTEIIKTVKQSRSKITMETVIKHHCLLYISTIYNTGAQI
jgi:hypothetical protein